MFPDIAQMSPRQPDHPLLGTTALKDDVHVRPLAPCSHCSCGGGGGGNPGEAPDLEQEEERRAETGRMQQVDKRKQ